jgi:hypothetical protein
MASPAQAQFKPANGPGWAGLKRAGLGQALGFGPGPAHHYSTGIVHIGKMEVEPFGPTIKVAVKLAFSKEHKLALEQEHQLYSHMNSKGICGIPQSLGLFVGLDCDNGAEGSYALVMTYASMTLFGQKVEASPSVK